MDAVHEGRVVAHFRRQRAEQVVDALLVLHVHIEIANQDDTAISARAGQHFTHQFAVPRPVHQFHLGHGWCG